MAVLFSIGVATMAAGLAGASFSDLWPSMFGPREDGSWKAVSLDGQPVGSGNFLVVIKRGKVIGGYDDCNGWAYQDEGPDRKGERKMISTLVECPDEEARRTYRVLVYAPSIELLGDRVMRLTRAGHRGLFRRCKPDRERFRCEPVQ